MTPRWVLPEYIEDALPTEAMRIERLRRRMLDLFVAHGYELVIPPIIEYLDSLLTGTGGDLDLQTFKLVDQLNGRMLGLRADITPQAARIDAHLLNRKGVARLCYAGSVVHTLPVAGSRTRESMQVGAELFGHRGLESDIEVQRLMLAALAQAGIAAPQIDLGHVGVLRSLVSRSGLNGRREDELFLALQAKDLPELRALLREVEAPYREALELLPQLYGDETVLREAGRRLPRLPEIAGALRDLRRLAAATRDLARTIQFDLGELRGYRYHSGVVFAVYAPGFTAAVARGGRYDEVGEAFGRARAATGFSLDVRELAGACGKREQRRILAPAARAPQLERLVAELRGRGEIVVAELPGHADTRQELGCDHVIARVGGRWQVRALDRAQRPAANNGRRIGASNARRPGRERSAPTG
ncbi:MAG: ATP phosphoribosyltransferase regulatory subunit [Betaproteobacteria bacterium]|nr:ATP phosphoribosyltransferase regulatory subunit [Betaproteobacteria bacterium]